MVLVPGELHMARSLKRTFRRGGFDIRADTAFQAVMEACAEPRPDQAGTWITPEMIDAYVGLHRAGYAHSIETLIGGELAGGLYGIAIGRVFFGESMFARVTDASKVAFVALVTAAPALGVRPDRLPAADPPPRHLRRPGNPQNRLPGPPRAAHPARRPARRPGRSMPTCWRNWRQPRPRTADKQSEGVQP
jgi:hypothetical protein